MSIHRLGSGRPCPIVPECHYMVDRLLSVYFAARLSFSRLDRTQAKSESWLVLRDLPIARHTTRE